MKYETLIYEKKGGIGIITLNRPQSLNAINNTMAGELEKVIDQAAKDNSVRVLIITGGKKVFCCGADVKERAAERKDLLDQLYARRNYRFYQKIEDMGKPVIAAIAGHCLGGGLEIALSCDFRIAAQNASIGDAHSKVGLIGYAGALSRLPRLIGISKAKELIFLGNAIDASEAYRIGLVNRIAPIESLMDSALEMAEVLKQRPPITLRLAKMCINNGMNMDFFSALEYEQKCSVILGFSEDAREGMNAFLEKRNPTYKGR